MFRLKSCSNSRIAAFLGWLLLTAQAQAQNFLCTDGEVRQAAEAARVRSALFWTGRQLPGNWAQPCPVTVNFSSNSSSGVTTFSIQDGEVFGWRMTVAGTRAAILQDALPHEVDHAVRASLVRRPLPRWLDEGSAMLFESSQEHVEQRRLAASLEHWDWGTELLDDKDYPQDPAAMRRVYAVGFSLVEFLIEQKGPGELLALQQDTRPASQAIQERYRLSPAEFRNAWRDWLAQRRATDQKCESIGCPFHTMVKRLPACNCTTQADRLLVIWTATWCGPCRLFWRDFDQDPVFRQKLLTRFHIHAFDLDAHSFEAQAHGITKVPTFCQGNQCVSGYLGKDWLLKQLGMEDSVSPAPPSPPMTAVPVPNESLPPAPAENPLPRGHPATGTPGPSSKHHPLENVAAVAARAAPIVLTGLQLAGIIGGGALTGGVGSIALAALFAFLRRRKSPLGATAGNLLHAASNSLPNVNNALSLANTDNSAGSSTDGEKGGNAAALRLPFPRQLDEATQLLGLGKSEGRVAPLDALRGMFLEDEIEKLSESADTATKNTLMQLKTAIDARVGEVAPLSTQVGN